MKKALVAYFSASGKTKKLAEELSKAVNGDLFEIAPEIPYTKADLNWMNKSSRSSLEMNDPASRPAFIKKPLDTDSYDVVFVGFPIWWYRAPSIINTFLETYDFSGKTVVPFATSGSSEMGKTNEWLVQSCPGARLLEGKVLKSLMRRRSPEEWVKTLDL